jgi:hypothetical protein
MLHQRPQADGIDGEGLRHVFGLESTPVPKPAVLRETIKLRLARRSPALKYVNRQRLPGWAFGRIHRKPEARLIRCCRCAVRLT